MDHVFNFWLSVIAISIIGALAHFVYEWAHHNRTIGLFTAVNESTWEHIKIALTGAFLWGLYDGFVYGYLPNYFLAKLTSLLVIAITIPSIFYFYRRIPRHYRPFRFLWRLHDPHSKTSQNHPFQRPHHR